MNSLRLNDILKIKHPESSNLFNEFHRIAEHLFKEFRIAKDDKIYRPTEVEFYFFKPGIHDDVHAYCNERQKELGRLFRHRTGIDITFGTNGSFGGILIRGISDITNNKYINGCWNVLKELSDGYTQISSDDLEKKVDLIEASNELDIILFSTRIGLKEKIEDTDSYISRNYRFVTEIKVTNKFKEKEKVAVVAYKTEILKINGIKEKFGYIPHDIKVLMDKN